MPPHTQGRFVDFQTCQGGITSVLSPEILTAFSEIDFLTIPKAIEAFQVSDPTAGCASMALRCLTAEWERRLVELVRREGFRLVELERAMCH